ncbi:MAG: PTS fructose transporter subunit IIA [Gammaproteobacteria bacterium]
MSVGILLVTHSGIGNALLNTAYNTFGNLPLPITQLSVSRDPDPELMVTKAAYLVKKLDSGQGVLIATDMYGSTPSNIAQNLQNLGYPIRIVSGLNLPMLFRILNYPFLSLSELVEKALSGGKEGIVESIQTNSQHHYAAQIASPCPNNLQEKCDHHD